MSEPIESTPPSSNPDLSSRRILRFFWPLALSWLFMAIEGPVSVSVIARLPEPTLNTAAFNLLMALALFMESPVIDLLSTSTTLAADRASYLTLRRFVLQLMGWETVLHAGFVLSPLYDAVTVGLMKVPADVAMAARTGLILMIPWSACIGWRRYHQGILIRFGQTRRVGAGTFLRLSVLAAVSLSLYVSRSVPGVVAAAAGLISSVFVEAVFAHWAARRTIREHFGEGTPAAEGEPLTVGRLARFHFPLTGTTIVMFLAGPLVTSALARSPDPEVAMAAWQVGMALLWLTRSAVYALPEVVITLGRHQGGPAALRRFCLQVGMYSSLILLGAWATGLAEWLFRHVLGAEPRLLPAISLTFILGLPLPMIAAALSYIRGMLTLRHFTASRLYAIGAGITVLVIGLQVSVALRIDGVLGASLANTVSLAAELAVLYAFWRRMRTTEAEPVLPSRT